MDLLNNSDSDHEDSTEVTAPSGPPLKAKAQRLAPVNAAPTVSHLASSRLTSTSTDLGTVLGHSRKRKLNDSSTALLMNNPKKDVMCQPVQGPQPDTAKFAVSRIAKQELQNNVTYDQLTFDEQRTSFQRTGRAKDMEGRDILRTTLGYNKNRLESFVKQQEQQQKRPQPSKKKNEELLVHGSDDEAEYGVWAPPNTEEEWHTDNALTDIQRGGIDSLAPEQLAERAYLKERDRQHGMEEEAKAVESAYERLVERKMSHLLPPTSNAANQAVEPSTEFHGPEEVDYKGKSWIAPPAGLGNVDEEPDIDHHRCHLPKKCIHKFSGHDKGVHRIRLFPNTGHLILSAGLDGTCKVWSVEKKQCMRTYKGHVAAVRDVQFNHDGTKFLSCSFDRYVRLWNTESGEVLQTFGNRKVPYVVKFYPLDDNFFVVGCSDNKIVTYDATKGDITQEYNHHLAPVNSIVFVEDQGVKMVSSSDDKKVLVWEWDIGVPIKYISDPNMHSIPSLVLHPAHKYIAGQSLDNTIVVFQAGQKFALQRKKKFAGHIVSGYACEMAFSTDGHYLVSGDGNGAVFVWDWKRHKILQKYRAHDNGPAICCAWHPLEPSLMFTCGWDGAIKIWK